MRLNIRGELKEWERPLVMGILNVTPDSFYAGSRVGSGELCIRCANILNNGADILDIGGYSTRPGAEDISVDEEISRVVPAVRAIRNSLGDRPLISVDTFRAEVAEESIKAGADIINDISGGDLDAEMYATVARLRVPYVLMHTRGNPQDMQHRTDYDDVAAEVLEDLAFKLARLRQLGVSDAIVDPGFGFAKTCDQNYELLNALPAFKALDAPILVGLSRKSMICKALDITSENALNGTTALNMAALIYGADILRVHDVREAAETVRLFSMLKKNSPESQNLIEVYGHFYAN